MRLCHSLELFLGHLPRPGRERARLLPAAGDDAHGALGQPQPRLLPRPGGVHLLQEGEAPAAAGGHRHPLRRQGKGLARLAGNFFTRRIN